MATVIGLACNKGGVGKSLLTLNIGVASSKLGHRVLIVDLDPEGLLAEELGAEAELRVRLVDALRKKDLRAAVQKTRHESVDVIPSHRDTEAQNLKDPVPSAQRLRQALESVTNDYDFVFVDCKGGHDLVTANVVLASNFVIVPTLAEGENATRALRTIKWIGSIFSEHETEKKWLGFSKLLVCDLDRRKKLGRWLRENVARLETPPFDTPLRTNAELEKARTARKDIFAWQKSRKRNRDVKRAAMNCMELAEEVIRHGRSRGVRSTRYDAKTAANG